MGEEAWSKKSYLTSLTATDTALYLDTSETDPRLKVKQVKVEELFGKTSGIPVDIGVGTAPSYRIHAKRTGTNCAIAAQKDSAGIAFIGGTDTSGRMGTASLHKLEVFANGSIKMEISTAGIISSPDTYGNDLNGSTIRTMVVADTGPFGYDSSTVRGKILNGELSYDKAKWILEIPIYNYSPKANPLMKRVGYTAESIAEKVIDNDTVVFYDTVEVVEGENVPIDTSKYQNWREIRKAGEKDKIKKYIAKEIIERDINQEDKTKDTEINITKQIQGVNDVNLMPYVIKILQNLEERVKALEAA